MNIIFLQVREWNQWKAEFHKKNQNIENKKSNFSSNKKLNISSNKNILEKVNEIENNKNNIENDKIEENIEENKNDIINNESAQQESENNNNQENNNNIEKNDKSSKVSKKDEKSDNDKKLNLLSPKKGKKMIIILTINHLKLQKSKIIKKKTKIIRMQNHHMDWAISMKHQMEKLQVSPQNYKYQKKK